MANKMIMTITISYPAKTRLEALASASRKSMSQHIEDLIMADPLLPVTPVVTKDKLIKVVDPALNRE